MNTSNKSIDQLLKDKLSQNGFAWNEGEWSAFNNKYNNGKKKRGIIWWTTRAAGILVLLGATLWGINEWWSGEKVETAIAKNENISTIQSPEKTVNNSTENNSNSPNQIPQVQQHALQTLAPYLYHTSAPAQNKEPLTTKENRLLNNQVAADEIKPIEETPKKVETEKTDPVPVAIGNYPKENVTTTIVQLPKVTPPLPDSASSKRINKPKNSATIIYYIEPVFNVGFGALAMESAGTIIIRVNNHSRNFSAKYTNGFGMNIGAHLNKNLTIETGVAQQQYTEKYTRNWSENIAVYTNKSYTTLKVDTATGKINSSPVHTSTKHDSVINHTDKSTNIYSFIQIPLMVYYHKTINKHFNIMVGAGSAINIMQLKNRNANELYGYDPTGNITQPKMFASYALKAGLEWRPFAKLSFTLAESIVMGKGYNDIYIIKLWQYASQVGIRFYLNTK